MKNVMKKSIAVCLIITLISSLFVCFAAQEKKYHNYESYVLLGDSVASGWSDIEHRDTSFKRVEGSYGALLADDLGVTTYHPMAGLAFRTVEIRYMLEDDFQGDEFLFYSVDKDLAESKIPEMRKAIAEADLITLNVGGNDWGSYVGWYVERAMEEIEGTENFVEKARPYLENSQLFGVDTIETLIEFADFAGCLPELLPILPVALKEGYKNYVLNWDIMIEDIYALNPDVTLVVIGMFDTAVQDETMNDIELDKFDITNITASGDAGQIIVDFANLTMRQGAEKYGYIFVDPVGTLCEKQHPSYAGHRHIADLILKALPAADFPYTDVDASHKNYAGIDYMYQNNYMAGISETVFGVDQAMTQKELYDVLDTIWGTEKQAADESAEVTRSKVAIETFKAVRANGSFDAIEFIAAFSLTIKEIFTNGFSSLTKSATRGDAATVIAKYAQL